MPTEIANPTQTAQTPKAVNFNNPPVALIDTALLSSFVWRCRTLNDEAYYFHANLLNLVKKQVERVVDLHEEANDRLLQETVFETLDLVNVLYEKFQQNFEAVRDMPSFLKEVDSILHQTTMVDANTFDTLAKKGGLS